MTARHTGYFKCDLFFPNHLVIADKSAPLSLPNSASEIPQHPYKLSAILEILIKIGLCIILPELAFPSAFHHGGKSRAKNKPSCKMKRWNHRWRFQQGWW